MSETQESRSFTKFKLLTGSLLLTVSASLWLVRPGNWEFSVGETAGLAVFVLLIVLAESFPIPIGAGRADITTAGIVYWAMIVLFTPFWATICALSGFLFTDLFVRRRPVQKAVFNTTQIGVSVVCASLVLGAIRVTPGLSANPRFFTGFLVAIATFWFLNTWLVSLAIHFWYGESTQRFWRRNYQWAWVYELSSAPIALVVAFAYDRLAIVGLILVALPTLMVRLAYSQYLDLKRTYNETVRTMVKIIEMHDPYTAGHSDRVARLNRYSAKGWKADRGGATADPNAPSDERRLGQPGQLLQG
jgi:hypothetical protein